MIRPRMKKSLYTWQVDLVNQGERLDSFVSQQLPELSRSQIQKRIKQGLILVQHASTSVHHFLKEGDVVDMIEENEAHTSKQKTENPSLLEAHQLPPLVIQKETADWMVIHKPVGLLVHPDRVQTQNTLVDLILAHDPHIAQIGGQPDRPGIVHRLDKEVSGLMVIAKTQMAYEHLQRQFAERRVKKTYIALVHHEVPQEEGEIKFRIARSSTKARMAARPEQEEEGQAAWTHYRVLRRFVGATFLELEILSGRTHQIRAHLLALRTPIMGDPLYQLKKTDRHIVCPRLMLQSIGLDFDDPSTGERLSFHLDADPAFKVLMTTL